MKGVNIFLADGFEDTEAIGTYDVLTRAGIKVNLISIDEDPFVKSSHGITIGVEQSIREVDLSAAGTRGSDVMIFPGGMPGTKSLAACKPLIKAMKEHFAAGGTLAAICAAPGLVLGQLDELEGVRMTCFDGFEQGLIAKGAEFSPERAIRDGQIITGRSAGHALAFGLAIVEKLRPEKVEEVRHALYLKTV